MEKLIYNWLEFISPILVVISFLLVFRRWRRIRSLKVLFVYFLSSSVNLGIASYHAEYNIPNMLWYNIHGFCSLMILSIFYYLIVRKQIYKRTIKVLSIVGLVSYLVVLFVSDDKEMFFSSGYSIVSLLIILFSIIFLREIFKDSSISSVYTDKTVWIVSGLLTYHLCSYLIHVTYKPVTEYFLNNPAENSFHPKQLWAIHNVIYFLACLFILLTLLRIPRPVTTDRK